MKAKSLKTNDLAQMAQFFRFHSTRIGAYTHIHTHVATNRMNCAICARPNEINDLALFWAFLAPNQGNESPGHGTLNHPLMGSGLNHPLNGSLRKPGHRGYRGAHRSKLQLNVESKPETGIQRNGESNHE